jgi:hypothetical protein
MINDVQNNFQLKYNVRQPKTLFQKKIPNNLSSILRKVTQCVTL